MYYYYSVQKLLLILPSSIRVEDWVDLLEGGDIKIWQNCHEKNIIVAGLI